MTEFEPTDFDITTEEGREDINEALESDPLTPSENETAESWMAKIRRRFGRAANYVFNHTKDLFQSQNPGRPVPAYMKLDEIEMDNMGESSADLSELRTQALLSKYPNLDENLIDITVDRDGKQLISFWSARSRSWTKAERLYNEDKTVRSAVDKKIKSGKYKQISQQLDGLDEQNQNLTEQNQRLRESLETVNENQQDHIREQIQTNENQIEENQQTAENLEERMPLRERVKRVFKKYGLTAASVAAAVGITIGVIVSQLSKGLTTVAKGVGNGLKTLGKKLGEILPGMVGAIASFIFKTAGQVISFVAEHAWLLIVAVVVYFIEKMK